jgi:hypothetical protein
VPAAVLLLFAFAARAQPRGAVDWVFLVDTSRSMRGTFPDVKASIDSFVREASDGDSVTVLTFDRDVHPRASMEIRGNARDDLIDVVNGLEADGKRTHLGLAIQRGLERAAKLRGDKTRVQSVVLFTDGKEDVRGIPNPVPISANLDRVEGTYVFFVSLGEHEHEGQLDEFANKAQNTTVLRAPTRDAIAEVAQKIRSVLPKPEPPRKIETRPQPVPEPRSPLRWLILLPIAAAVAWLAWAKHRKNLQLEGELEILQPRVAPEAAFVGLPRLAASEVALSAVVPAEALGGTDARLFVRRHGGRKEVWIAASGGGSLRVNDIETPTSALYDADTISIGDAKLRFNRVGHERTATPGEEEL